jgi:hypothetical protein
MDLQQILKDEGAMVFPALSVTQALCLAHQLLLSILSFVEPLCDALSQRQIPFIFYTAYPDRLSNRWSAAPLLSKPAPDSVIIGALKYVLCAKKHDYPFTAC